MALWQFRAEKEKSRRRNDACPCSYVPVLQLTTFQQYRFDIRPCADGNLCARASVGEDYRDG
jgi:hypothetical protein